MAKLRVSAEFLSGLLFPGAKARITGVHDYDEPKGIVTFEVEGNDVPDADVVVARIAETYQTCRFEPV